MSDTNRNVRAKIDEASILRAVFPQFTEEELLLAHDEFSYFLGFLYEGYLKQREEKGRTALTGDIDVIA